MLDIFLCLLNRIVIIGCSIYLMSLMNEQNLYLAIFISLNTLLIVDKTPKP